MTNLPSEKIEELKDKPLSIALQTAVPLWVAEIKDRGGLSGADLQSARETSTLLASKGDVLLFGGGKRGEVATVFNRVAKAIAILSFLPGGVTLFGSHWESKMEEVNNEARR